MWEIDTEEFSKRLSIKLWSTGSTGLSMRDISLSIFVTVLLCFFITILKPKGNAIKPAINPIRTIY